MNSLVRRKYNPDLTHQRLLFMKGKSFVPHIQTGAFRKWNFITLVI